MDHLNVTASLDTLKAVRDFVRAAAAAAGIERQKSYRLVLGVDEVATNIVTHGYQESGLTGDIDVFTEITPESLNVSIEDTAPRYDPLEHTDPENLDEPLEERPIGGLGVFLAKRGVDQFRYEYVNGRNRNTFIMHRDSKPA